MVDSVWKKISLLLYSQQRFIVFTSLLFCHLLYLRSNLRFPFVFCFYSRLSLMLYIWHYASEKYVLFLNAWTTLNAFENCVLWHFNSLSPQLFHLPGKELRAYRERIILYLQSFLFIKLWGTKTINTSWCGESTQEKVLRQREKNKK